MMKPPLELSRTRVQALVSLGQITDNCLFDINAPNEPAIYFRFISLVLFIEHPSSAHCYNGSANEMTAVYVNWIRRKSDALTLYRSC